MDAPQMPGMAEATRLTRDGRLADATRLIQRTLAHSAMAPRAVATLHGPGIAKGPAGRFDTSSYVNAAGARTYRLYVPTGCAGQPLPLVVMLHGGTQDGAMFASATGMNDLAERDTFLVAYPEQAQSANAGRYWNWFEPAHQRRGTGEPSLIAGITGQVVDRYGIDTARIYVAGFSAGGAMAAVMAATYPDVYAAAGVHSGLPFASAGDVTSAFAAMRNGPARSASPTGTFFPLIIFHGDRDATVADVNAGHLIEDALATAHSERAGTAMTAVTSRGRIPAGHGYTRTRYQGPSGVTVAERWTIHGGGHCWFGGAPGESYTDPRGPSASEAIIGFFDGHPARS